jgi:hypothetical protein
VVISFPGTELNSRDVVIGLTIDGSARAYPWDTFVKQSPVLDRVNGTPLLLVLDPDGKSFRVFVRRIDGHDAEFFLQTDAQQWTLLDATTASQWNFQGCATSGPAKGRCLDQIPALKDYWFDWRNYHPETTIYKR